MKKLEDIDKNLKVETKLSEKDLQFFNVNHYPFTLYGFLGSDKTHPFARIPQTLADNTNEGVAFLYENTAGVRVRFKTNSPYVAISAKYSQVTHFPHMALTGSAGFDIYEKVDNVYKYLKTFVPPIDLDNKGYEAIYYFENSGMHDITINFPLYSSVSGLFIGLSNESELLQGDKYMDLKPIVYYGSSITQGGCASRPGNSYQGIISRRIDCDYINLGFSGSAKGEKCMAEYISNIDMSCFVYDYDHNAPTPEHLEKTHKPMFDIIRSKNPNLPIIMLSSPNRSFGDKTEQRKNIIKATYNAAKSTGDNNVYFIDGEEIWTEYGGDSSTVDTCHPNDLGFMLMADAIEKELKKALKLN